METQKQAPWDLQVVALLFFLSGVLAVLEIWLSLMRGNISINFGVLGIFIGWGLLRFRRGWRTCALFFIWLALILLPLFGFFVLAGARPLDLKILGQRMGYASPMFGLAFTGVLFLFALWQYRVLTRPGVAQLFDDHAA
jgi:hypothetical protein